MQRCGNYLNEKLFFRLGNSIQRPNLTMFYLCHPHPPPYIFSFISCSIAASKFRRWQWHLFSIRCERQNQNDSSTRNKWSPWWWMETILKRFPFIILSCSESCHFYWYIVDVNVYSYWSWYPHNNVICKHYLVILATTLILYEPSTTAAINRNPLLCILLGWK